MKHLTKYCCEETLLEAMDVAIWIPQLASLPVSPKALLVTRVVSLIVLASYAPQRSQLLVTAAKCLGGQSGGPSSPPRQSRCVSTNSGVSVLVHKWSNSAWSLRLNLRFGQPSVAVWFVDFGYQLQYPVHDCYLPTL